MTEGPITGGCQCGAVRYELTKPVAEVSHCHCSMCRKLHGALFASFGTVSLNDLSITGEENLGTHRSSPPVARRFCTRCGGQVMSESDGNTDVVELALGTLDPGQAPGHDRSREIHIYWESKVPWYEPGDDLERVNRMGD